MRGADAAAAGGCSGTPGGCSVAAAEQMLVALRAYTPLHNGVRGGGQLCFFKGTRVVLEARMFFFMAVAEPSTPPVLHRTCHGSPPPGPYRDPGAPSTRR